MLVIGMPLVTRVGVGEGELGSSPQPASTREKTRAVRASNRAMRGLLNENDSRPEVGTPDPDRHRGCGATYCEWRAGAGIEVNRCWLLVLGYRLTPTTNYR